MRESFINGVHLKLFFAPTREQQHSVTFLAFILLSPVGTAGLQYVVLLLCQTQSTSTPSHHTIYTISYITLSVINKCFHTMHNYRQVVYTLWRLVNRPHKTLRYLPQSVVDQPVHNDLGVTRKKNVLELQTELQICHVQYSTPSGTPAVHAGKTRLSVNYPYTRYRYLCNQLHGGFGGQKL